MGSSDCGAESDVCLRTSSNREPSEPSEAPRARIFCLHTRPPPSSTSAGRQNPSMSVLLTRHLRSLTRLPSVCPLTPPVLCRAMRVCTFNTFQATTMPYRHVRRPGLSHTFAYFAHHNIDVVCLQETNAARMGPLMYAVWRLCLLLPLIRNSAVMEYVEYLAVAEGLFLPLFVNDNRTDIARTARQYGYAHYAEVHKPRYFLDCGLMILSRHPIDVGSVERTYLPRDAGNRPGILAATLDVHTGAGAGSKSGRTERVRVYTLHFVPTLLSVTPVFRALNTANRLLGRDTHQLRQQHLDTLLSDIRRRQRLDSELLVVVGGDFNVTAGSEEERAMSARMLAEAGVHLSSLQPRRATACERTFAHEGQVDYVAVCDRVMRRWKQSRQSKSSQQPPSLSCSCSGDVHGDVVGDGSKRSNGAAVGSDRCKFGDVLHVWPAHEAEQLHSTRIDSMFSSPPRHTRHASGSHVPVSRVPHTALRFCLSAALLCHRSDHYPVLLDLSFL